MSTTTNHQDMVAREHEPRSLAISEANAPMDPAEIIRFAIEKNISPESMDKLVALAERIDDRRREAAFTAAMIEFKRICPPVPRRTENAQFAVVRDGVKVVRKYASMDDIEETIKDPLEKCGLSYRFGDSTIKGGMLLVLCIVSHVAGHKCVNQSEYPIESNAGCSAQQKVGIADTYAMRRALVHAFGLASCNDDNDGNAPKGGLVKINQSQAANLDSMIDDVGADRAAFLKYMGVSKLADLPAARFSQAIAELERKREKNKRGGR